MGGGRSGPQFVRDRGRGRRRWAVLVFVAACGGGGVEFGPEAEANTAEWEPSQPLELEQVPVEDLDPRRVRLDPERYAGLERVCHLAHLGERQIITEPSLGPDPIRPVAEPLVQPSLDPPAAEEPTEDGPATSVQEISERRLIRCRTPMGEGWADLAVPMAAASLADYIRLGDRVRVRVAPDPGVDGHPLLVYLATVDTVALPPALEVQPTISASFARIAAADNREVHTCALAWIGSLDRVGQNESLPDDIRILAPVACRDAHGESWIMLAFPDVTESASLRIARGDVIAARLLEREFGSTGHPLVRYEGP